MRAFLPRLFCIAILCVTSGCITRIAGLPGSGNVTSETREVDAFTDIDCSGSGKLIVKQADEISLKVTCDDNLLDYVTTEVENGKLSIHTEGNIRPTQLTFEITCPELTEVSRSGSGTSELLDIAGDSLSVGVSGSGHVTGNGTVNTLDANITGSGKLELKELQATKVDVQVTGSGHAEVHATEEFKGSVTGSGRIVLHGTPISKKESITGSGSIKMAE